MVYVVMMFVSYLIIYLSTKYDSWFNIWASTEHRRLVHHDSPSLGQGGAEHQLRVGHLHARVQPDGLTVLHGAPLGATSLRTSRRKRMTRGATYPAR